MIRTKEEEGGGGDPLLTDLGMGKDKCDVGGGNRLMLTIPSLVDPTTEYRVSLKSRPALLWSKLANFLDSNQRQTKKTENDNGDEYLLQRSHHGVTVLQDQCFASLTTSDRGDGAEDYGGEDDDSLLSYHYLQDDKTVIAMPEDKEGGGHPIQVQYVALPHLESNLSLEECWDASNCDAGDLSATLAATTTSPRSSNAGLDIELELASIQALMGRDDDTTDSEKQLLEQLIESSERISSGDDEDEEEDSEDTDEDVRVGFDMDVGCNDEERRANVSDNLKGEESTSSAQENDQTQTTTLELTTQDKSLKPRQEPWWLHLWWWLRRRKHAQLPSSRNPSSCYHQHHHQQHLEGITPHFQNVFCEFMYYYRWVLADLRARHQLFRHDHTAFSKHNHGQEIVTYFHQPELEANGGGALCSLWQEFWYYYPSAIETSMDQLGVSRHGHHHHGRRRLGRGSASQSAT